MFVTPILTRRDSTMEISVKPRKSVYIVCNVRVETAVYFIWGFFGHSNSI